MLENIIKGNKKWRGLLLVGIVAALGIALIIVSGAGGLENKSESVTEQSSYDDADAYARALEQRIAELCSSVRGAGDVKVMVSLVGGYKTVYALDSQSSSSGYKSEVVMSGSGSSQKPLVAAYENPQIAGVGIVCTGGGDAEVRRQMISLVSAVLGVSTNKIFVAAEV